MPHKKTPVNMVKFLKYLLNRDNAVENDEFRCVAFVKESLLEGGNKMKNQLKNEMRLRLTQVWLRLLVDTYQNEIVSFISKDIIVRSLGKYVIN